MLGWVSSSLQHPLHLHRTPRATPGRPDASGIQTGYDLAVRGWAGRLQLRDHRGQISGAATGLGLPFRKADGSPFAAYGRQITPIASELGGLALGL
jgi:hypothetical protein